MALNPFQQLKKYFQKRRELELFKQASGEEVFTHIYRENKWGDKDSRSGKGSNLDRTQPVRQQLPDLLEKLEARSLLDIPCGDFFWMKETDIKVDQYIGADIVATLIADNQRKFASEQRQFVHIDLLNDDLPKADVILCRDCLVHLCFDDIRSAIKNIKASGATYLLTTSFPQRAKNKDIVTGKHRQLNLQASPLDWPPPLMAINEFTTSGVVGEKILAVWKIADLS